jgi:myosin heavy subunit
MQQQLHVNDKVYIKDEVHVWLPARVIETNNNNTTDLDHILVEIDLPFDWARTTMTTTTTQKQQEQDSSQQQLQGERRWVHLNDYKDRKLPLQNVATSSSSSSSSSSNSESGARGDITALTHLHEAAVLYQIKCRHVNQMPYTRVGDILIAVNPCTWIDSLYTADQRHLYAKNFVWHGKHRAVADTNIKIRMC